MNINRHNYETFFLLYVDNELSAAERKAVEVFVQENADLKEELQLLQQTVFSAADIVFENKESLLKDELASVKENLLLYLDKELDAAAVLQTEQLLYTDSTAQKEFALLQKTQLQPLLQYHSFRNFRILLYFQEYKERNYQNLYTPNQEK